MYIKNGFGRVMCVALLVSCLCRFHLIITDLGDAMC